MLERLRGIKMHSILVRNFLLLGLTFLGVNFQTASFADDITPVISNLKFGLVCGTADNRRVCFQTATVQVTNESRCVFNQVVIPCTWYGFSFDYQTSADIAINCEDTTDVPIELGNPKEELQTSGSNFKYDIGLRQGSHHFFIAKYIRGEKGENSLRNEVVTCSLRGKLLFSQTTEMEFPTIEQPVASVPDLNTSK